MPPKWRKSFDPPPPRPAHAAGVGVCAINIANTGPNSPSLKVIDRDSHRAQQKAAPDSSCAQDCCASRVPPLSCATVQKVIVRKCSKDSRKLRKGFQITHKLRSGMKLRTRAASFAVKCDMILHRQSRMVWHTKHMHYLFNQKATICTNVHGMQILSLGWEKPSGGSKCCGHCGVAPTCLCGPTLHPTRDATRHHRETETADRNSGLVDLCSRKGK